MGYAVELYFDHHTEARIQQIRRALAKQGIAVMLDHLGDRPHVSLAVLPSTDREVLLPLVQAFATDLLPFEIQLSAIGTFPTDENVLFLVPVPTLPLLTAHRELHQRFTEAKLVTSSYYVPNTWVPHCSIEMNIPVPQLASAVEQCKLVFQPLKGQFQEIGVVEFRPVKSLATWWLGDKPS